MSVPVSCSFRTNQSKKFKLVWFCYAVCNHHFWQVIFSDASTSGFKSELLILNDCMLSWQVFMLFLKVLMRKVLTGCKIVLWYKFRQIENGKLLRWDFFSLLPLKIILTSFVKCFRKTLCMKSSLFCDFSDWKHVRTIATCKKKTFSSKTVLKTMFCYFWKIRSQSNDLYHSFHTFAIKVKSI